MNLFKLADISKGRLFGASLDINGFSIDTRSIKNNDLFIALKGENFDGHEFISEAISKGAGALVVNRSIQSDIPHILVDNTYEFIKQVALFNREQFTGKMIGITGTNGKTTSKQITSNLLSQVKSCHKTTGNKNNQLGVPYSLLTLEESHEFSVIEMGTSEPGEITILNEKSFFWPLYHQPHIEMLFEQNHKFNNAYSHHLWESSGKKYLDTLTKDIILNTDTTFTNLVKDLI